MAHRVSRVVRVLCGICIVWADGFESTQPAAANFHRVASAIAITDCNCNSLFDVDARIHCDVDPGGDFAPLVDGIAESNFQCNCFAHFYLYSIFDSIIHTDAYPNPHQHTDTDSHFDGET